MSDHRRCWCGSEDFTVIYGRGEFCDNCGATIESYEPTMSDKVYAAFIELLMCSDPSPLDAEPDAALRQYADHRARYGGFTDWVDAFHRLPTAGEQR